MPRGAAARVPKPAITKPHDVSNAATHSPNGVANAQAPQGNKGLAAPAQQAAVPPAIGGGITGWVTTHWVFVLIIVLVMLLIFIGGWLFFRTPAKTAGRAPPPPPLPTAQPQGGDAPAPAAQPQPEQQSDEELQALLARSTEVLNGDVANTATEQQVAKTQSQNPPAPEPEPVPQHQPLPDETTEDEIMSYMTAPAPVQATTPAQTSVQTPSQAVMPATPTAQVAQPETTQSAEVEPVATTLELDPELCQHILATTNRQCKNKRGKCSKHPITSNVGTPL